MRKSSYAAYRQSIFGLKVHSLAQNLSPRYERRVTFIVGLTFGRGCDSPQATPLRTSSTPSSDYQRRGSYSEVVLRRKLFNLTSDIARLTFEWWKGMLETGAYS